MSRLYCPQCGGPLQGSWGLYSTQGKPCWDCAQKEFAAEQRANNGQGLWQPASADDGMRNMDVSDVCGGQTDCEPATVSVDAGALDMVRRLVEHIESGTCTHEETITDDSGDEICVKCHDWWLHGGKGKPEFQWPTVVVDARRLLAGGE